MKNFKIFAATAAATLVLFCAGFAACSNANSSDLSDNENSGYFSSFSSDSGDISSDSGDFSGDSSNSSSNSSDSSSDFSSESSGEEGETYYITIVRADGSVSDNRIAFTADNFGEVFSFVLQNYLTPSTEKYEYSWKDDLPEEFELRDYVLTEQKSLKRYKVTFFNYDGSVWAEIDFAYGEIPDANGVPERNAEGGVEYEFSGWTPALSPVKQNAEYTACFKIKSDNETQPLPIG